MRPPLPDDMGDPQDPMADDVDLISDQDAGAVLDVTALAALRARFEGQLAASGLEESYFEALHAGIERYSPDVVRASLDSLRGRFAGRDRLHVEEDVSIGSAPGRKAAGMAGKVTVTKLFGRWPRRDPGQHSLFRTVGFGVAAGAVFLAGGVALRQSAVGRALFSSRRANEGHTEASLAERVYAAPAGRRASVMLADGSHVILSPGSQLRVDTGFGMRTRDVRLDGEAYFTVIHDPVRPFAVHTSRAVVRDLGTAFNVRAYPESPSVEVAVTEGLVALAAAHAISAKQWADSTVLRASDIGIVTTNGRLMTERGGDIASRTAWTHGELIFNARPLAEVLPTLARWYDLDIRLDDPALGTRRLTTTLHDESVERALTRVALALDLQVTRAGRVVTLGGGR